MTSHSHRSDILLSPRIQPPILYNLRRHIPNPRTIQMHPYIFLPRHFSNPHYLILREYNPRKGIFQTDEFSWGDMDIFT
jgi:hypothetical protein